MSSRSWLFVAAMVLAGCSKSSPPQPAAKGRLVVAVTLDWEGAYLSPEGLDALDALRKGLPDVPITHFVSAAYFTKDSPDPRAVSTIVEAVRKGDELAVHLHAWKSLALAAGIEPKLNPSFLTGTDKLMQFEDGDVGFDTDLEVYSVVEARALIRTSRKLLEQTRLPISKSFRAGGYLATPRILQAIREEGFAVDSSATNAQQLDARQDAVLPRRIREVWPKVETATQPFFVEVPGGKLLELPIAAIADYVTAAELVGVLEAAHGRLQQEPARDVVVVLGFHQETSQEFAGRLGEALQQVRARKAFAADLLFTTIESAAERVHGAVTPTSRR
jgi:hypothetical protein